MRSVFPLTYDRVDVLMSAGCSTLVSAAAILIVPRVGAILLEMLVGLFFIGCAVVAVFAFAGGGMRKKAWSRQMEAGQESGRLIAMIWS